jgi:hypothetical protein
MVRVQAAALAVAAQQDTSRELLLVVGLDACLDVMSPTSWHAAADTSAAAAAAAATPGCL